MTVHSSLRDKKFIRPKRSRGKVNHPGQVYGSARKRGASQEKLDGLRKTAFRRRKIKEEDLNSKWDDFWED